ncbi:hypothetical protein DFQ28_003951 [Apophysomyces sp. BC1034]|nr:hypothetical protein DFQ30_003673 [Apophysomyces sp. BC1015]KAG0178658.1 hypothetical protein DFQ29_003193 [Apophysomyces sp. BC1021]KAG0189051.1 hypothetical protein DFQ28_003951 [Apophysomyces sp. BC1034]
MSPTKDDATISLEIDPTFTGVFRGTAYDESDGCVLNGTCVVQVHRPIKVRRLLVWFEGRCKINLKSNVHSYGMPTTEGFERRTLFSKDVRFIGDDAQIHTLPVGKHTYSFQFDLPANLPASYGGNNKRGYIRYRLQAGLYRPMFSNDLTCAKEIPLRRCLLENPADVLLDTVHGTINAHKLRYHATAPTMAYREGGLVQLDLGMSLTRPESQTIKSVTCALRERVHYRTTDVHGHTVHQRTDDTFPLGYSTFRPAADQPAGSYNAMFRLCPRVSADTNCKLLKVTHALVVNIIVEDPLDEDATRASDTEEEPEDVGYESGKDFETSLPSPPHSRPTTPTLSRSSSSSSITSLRLFRRASEDPQRQRAKRNKGETLCSLEFPVVVTSREHFWDGAMPDPPSYATADAPPSYCQSIEALPRAPIYPPTTSTTSTS